MSADKISREERDANDRFEQTHGPDPAKEFRVSLDGAELFKDEYFDSKDVFEASADANKIPSDEFLAFVEATALQLSRMNSRLMGGK